MKRLLLFSASCFFCLASFSQTTSVTAGLSPKVIPPTSPVTTQQTVETQKVEDNNLVPKESEFNFGKIPQGKPVTHEFIVTNNSKAPFKLDNVKASCGCTTPEWNKDEIINPGKEALIKVGYNAASPGPFNKTITITYNGDQSKEIFIKGEVWNTPAASAPENTNLKNLN